MPTVIKAGESGKLSRRLATVDLADHLREAESVIAQAHRRADADLTAARTESTHIRELAQSEGYRDGFEQGLVEGRAKGYADAKAEALAQFGRQQTPLVQSLAEILTSLNRTQTDIAIAAQRHAVEFAVLLARKMTFAIGRLHHQSAEENFRRALTLVGQKTDVIIRVHPTDRAAMDLFAPALIEKLNESRHIVVETDESIAPGGCRVHSGETEVDATLETQTDELVRLLLGDSGPSTPGTPAGESHV